MFQVKLFYPATVSLLLGLSFVLACDFGSEELTSNGSDVRSHTGSDGEGLAGGAGLPCAGDPIHKGR
mgnify:CR=1 FL=1